MRQETIHNFKIRYPEDLVFTLDSNYIAVSNESVGQITVTATVTHPNGSYRSIGYAASGNSLVLDLSLLLREINDGNTSHYGCSLRLFAHRLLIGTFDFSFKLLSGKSYTNKSHGIENTIYVYDFEQLKKIEIFAVDNCSARIGNSVYSLTRGFNKINLYNDITTFGTHTLCLSTQTVNPSVAITSYVPQPFSATLNLDFETGTPSAEMHKGGDIWKPGSTIMPVCHKIEVVEDCLDNNTFEVMYVNSDGCTRHLAGIIAEETNTSKSDVYKITYDAFANISTSWAYASERKVKVFFGNIARDAYINDILLSQNIRYRNYDGEYFPCRLATEKITVTSADYDDYTLEFVISE